MSISMEGKPEPLSGIEITSANTAPAGIEVPETTSSITDPSVVKLSTAEVSIAKPTSSPVEEGIGLLGAKASALSEEAIQENIFLISAQNYIDIGKIYWDFDSKQFVDSPIYIERGSGSVIPYQDPKMKKFVDEMNKLGINPEKLGYKIEDNILTRVFSEQNEMQAKNAINEGSIIWNFSTKKWEDAPVYGTDVVTGQPIPQQDVGRILLRDLLNNMKISPEDLNYVAEGNTFVDNNFSSRPLDKMPKSTAHSNVEPKPVKVTEEEISQLHESLDNNLDRIKWNGAKWDILSTSYDMNLLQELNKVVAYLNGHYKGQKFHGGKPIPLSELADFMRTLKKPEKPAAEAISVSPKAELPREEQITQMSTDFVKKKPPYEKASPIINIDTFIKNMEKLSELTPIEAKAFVSTIEEYVKSNTIGKKENSEMLDKINKRFAFLKNARERSQLF